MHNSIDTVPVVSGHNVPALSRGGRILKDIGRAFRILFRDHRADPKFTRSGRIKIKCDFSLWHRGTFRMK
jgi:hypothetical protein